MREFLKVHWRPLFFLTLLFLILTRHIWGTRGWIETHDGIFHVIRLESFVASLRIGDFPVRWAYNLDNGYGLPLFNFVYPLPYYLGSPLLLVGISSKWVIKLLGMLAFALGIYGYYFLGTKKSKTLGLLAGLVYATTPYILVNLFVRGALGELFALSLFPWVVLNFFTLRRHRLSFFTPLPLAFMLLSHNFLGFILLLLALLLTFIWRLPLKKIIISTLISLSLSAFFVLPMLFERTLVHSGASSDYTYTFRDHFIYPMQLISSPWGLGHSVAGSGDGFSLELGLPHLMILVSCLVLLTRLQRRSHYLYLVITLSTLYLILPLSTPLWELLPPLQIMQFPWRLLGVFAVLTPLLLSLTPSLSKRSITFFSLLLTVSTIISYRYTTPFYFQNNDQFATQLYIHRDKTTTSKRTELLPKWASVVERYPPLEPVRIISGSAALNLLSNTPTNLIFKVQTTDHSASILLSRNYYPSWVLVDENKVEYALHPSDTGELIFAPPVGENTYSLRQRSTTLAFVSNLISVSTLLFLLLLSLRPKLKKILDQKYAGWDLSIALRYLPIVDDLNKRAKPQDKILEVGSEITGITPYYPRQVTGLDQGFDYSKKNQYLKPVVGSATAIPYKDQVFDYTLSVDCLEHIPSKQRGKAVLEMLRVTKKRLYLTFPAGALSEQTDARLDAYFFAKNGYHFTYLAEHVENGLPALDFIPKLIAKNPAWELETRGNTSLWLWELMLKLALSNESRKTSLYRRLLFLTPLLKRLNFAPTYRLLYVFTRRNK